LVYSVAFQLLRLGYLCHRLGLRTDARMLVRASQSLRRVVTGRRKLL
jgi:hypothetical protein